jgi:hypothetical protein
MSFFKKIFGKEIVDQITPSCDDAYNQLLRDCMAEVDQKNTELAEEYGFGSFERWDIDQEIGSLIFSDNEEVKLTCKIVMLGSFSESSQSWMWGWANPSLLDHLTIETEKVKQHGETNSIPDLTTPKTEATESEAWALSSYACRILGGRGLYKGPTGNGCVIMMITELNRSEPVG